MENRRTSSFEEILQTDGVLVYTNKGVSMMPLLRQGKDLMIIRKKSPERCRKYDAVLFRRESGSYVLHRILKVLPDGYWIVGDNCYVGEKVRDDRIFGVLTGIKRGKKEISVTDTAYRLYVHLWCDVYPLRFFLLRIKALCRKVFRKLKTLLGKSAG